MKIDDLNIKNILIKKNIKVDIDIGEDLLLYFNTRKFNPSNINDIIKLCHSIVIENLQTFIIKYIVPTKDLYIISDENKKLITL